jgi:uridine kinase
MSNVIRKDKSLPTVEIHLPDKQVLSGPRGTPIGEFLREIYDEDESPIVGAIVNDSLRELTYPVELEAEVIPVTMSDGDGARIYRRSVTFLMVTAFKELFPDAGLIVDHSVASGGFYCEVTNRGPLTQEELYNLDATMRDMVAQDLPFEKRLVPLQKAIEYFRRQNLTEKVRLLKYRTKDTLVLYTLKKHSDYHHGYMVPSTGYLKWFTLNPFGEGFVLQYPRRNSPKTLLPLPGYPQLLKTFRQYGDWLERLGIDNVGALNDAIHSGRAKELILVSEALHEQKIAEIARKIADRSSKSRIILIAGPSSSGKTTFSKRLAIQLLALGLSPFALEMDNYFVDREKTPLDSEGKPNFEAFETLNTHLLGEQVAHLLAGDEVQMPHFNFKSGKSEKGDLVKLQKDQLIILEGIHGLNPRLLPNISPERTFKIYISCLTQLNLDRHNRISTTDTRLLRRIVRDSATRGYNAAQTMQRWESVRKGEKEHIFPYQEDADDLFNSALVYELSALRPWAEPILRQVPFGSLEYIEAKRLLALLEWFLELPGGLIPDNSILREFIGGSILGDFVVWKNHEP